MKGQLKGGKNYLLGNAGFSGGNLSSLHPDNYSGGVPSLGAAGYGTSAIGTHQMSNSTGGVVADPTAYHPTTGGKSRRRKGKGKGKGKTAKRTRRNRSSRKLWW